MNFRFKNIKISGILTILPDHVSHFEDELENYNFSKAKSVKLKKVMGYDRHRLVDESTCISDLAIFGFEYLFENNYLKKVEIDALVLVSQSPDHFIPPTSAVIHGKLQLKNDIFCIDINQGCTGYLVGLIESFLLLEQESIKKVILVNADVLSRKVSRKDRNSFPLIGDAASITIIEKDDSNSEVFANIQMDGSRREALMIPAGGFRLPSSSSTSVLEEDDKGNLRAKDHLVMQGDAIFNFVQTEVPPMINALFEFAKQSIDTADFFMCHQPNKFMLQKLADKMKIKYEKMPNNVVENFGNSSGATIPTTITFNCGDDLLSKEYKICLAGFGVGVTWSSMLINLGNLNVCKIIEYPLEEK